MAFLKGDRSVIVRWGLADRPPFGRIIYITEVRHWYPPHDGQQLTDSEREKLRW
jgi:hypothetical protein